MSNEAAKHILQREEWQKVVLFDVETVRSSWFPTVAAWRHDCGHYHAEGLDYEFGDPRRWTAFPQTSAVVFATNRLGTVVAMRVLRGECVGILSILNVSEDDEALALLWIDSITFKLD